MARLKIYSVGILEKTGRMVTDFDGRKFPHTRVMTHDVIKVREIERLAEEEPNATVKRLLELTK